jgi:hypothetical protein
MGLAESPGRAAGGTAPAIVVGRMAHRPAAGACRIHAPWKPNGPRPQCCGAAR